MFIHSLTEYVLIGALEDRGYEKTLSLQFRDLEKKKHTAIKIFMSTVLFTENQTEGPRTNGGHREAPAQQWLQEAQCHLPISSLKRQHKVWIFKVFNILTFKWWLNYFF